MLLLLSSCNHKDLIYSDRASVAVSFDWTDYPDASPEMMRVAVFTGEAQPVYYPFTNRQGGAIDVYKGYTYNFISYNSDVETVITSGSTYDDFQFECTPTELASFAPMFVTHRAGENRIPRAQGTETLPVVSEPDPMWYSTLTNITINNGNTITMPMRSPITYYTFTIRNVENMSNVSAIVATISGMSQSFSPSQGRCTDSRCIIPFNMKTSGENEIKGTLRTFGHFPTAEQTEELNKMLVIYVELGDTRKIYYTFDVTEAIDKASSNPGVSDVDIVLERLPIPKPLYNGSGLHPTVDGWEEVQIGIDL